MTLTNLLPTIRDRLSVKIRAFAYTHNSVNTARKLIYGTNEVRPWSAG